MYPFYLTSVTTLSFLLWIKDSKFLSEWLAISQKFQRDKPFISRCPAWISMSEIYYHLKAKCWPVWNERLQNIMPHRQISTSQGDIWINDATGKPEGMKAIIRKMKIQPTYRMEVNSCKSDKGHISRKHKECL